MAVQVPGAADGRIRPDSRLLRHGKGTPIDLGERGQHDGHYGLAPIPKVVESSSKIIYGVFLTRARAARFDNLSAPPNTCQTGGTGRGARPVEIWRATAKQTNHSESSRTMIPVYKYAQKYAAHTRDDDVNRTGPDVRALRVSRVPGAWVTGSTGRLAPWPPPCHFEHEGRTDSMVLVFRPQLCTSLHKYIVPTRTQYL